VCLIRTSMWTHYASGEQGIHLVLNHWNCPVIAIPVYLAA